MKKLLLTGIALILFNGCALTDHLIITKKIPDSGIAGVNIENTVKWTVATIGEIAGIVLLGGGAAGGGLVLRRRIVKKRNGTGNENPNGG